MWICERCVKCTGCTHQLITIDISMLLYIYVQYRGLTSLYVAVGAIGTTLFVRTQEANELEA